MLFIALILCSLRVANFMQLNDARERYLPNLVNISQGLIQGVEVTGEPSGEKAIAFLGIPFAEDTSGKKRFSLPKLRAPWTGIRATTKYAAACVADPVLTYKTPEGGPISEDCLHINVITNGHCMKNGGCAILAIVHGGKFNFESPAIFPPEVLSNNFVNQGRNVIVVSLPFRLGVFGWMNLAPFEKTSAPKNVAMHDIILGLQWVQSEIIHFGGDPKRVTLMGHSSGSCIADLVSLSPVSRGLFNQLILMSGMAQIYGYDLNPIVNLVASEAVAERVGCWRPNKMAGKVLQYKTIRGIPKEAVEHVIECMRHLPYQKLLKAQMDLYNSTEDFYGASEDEWLLPGSIHELMKKRIPRRTLMGTLSAESKMTIYIEKPDGYANETLLTETCRHLGYEMAYKTPEHFTLQCRKTFAGYKQAREIFDQFAFYKPAGDIADYITNLGGEVFVYSYTYADAGAAFKNLTQLPLERRPCHSEDTIYLLGIHRGVFTEKDYQNNDIYSGLLARFINGEAPHPNWKPWTVNNSDYFEINFNRDLNLEHTKSGYYVKEREFWSGRNLGEVHRLRHFPPSFDVFNGENLITALDSHTKQVSSAHDKTLYGEERIYWEWTDWLNAKRQRHLQNFGNSIGQAFHEFRALNSSLLDPDLGIYANVTAPTEGSTTIGGMSLWGVIGIGLLVLVVAILFYFIVRKCIHMRETQYYELLQ